MDLSERNKRKHMAKAVELLAGDGSRPIDYAVAGGGALPPNLLGWLVLAGAVALSIAASFALRGIVVLGLLPGLAVYFGLNQPRGVLYTDRGVASFRCGFLNGRPANLIGGDYTQVLHNPIERKAGYARVRIARDTLWLKEADIHRFLAAPPATP